MSCEPNLSPVTKCRTALVGGWGWGGTIKKENFSSQAVINPATEQQQKDCFWD